MARAVSTLLLLLASPAAAQFGRRNVQQDAGNAAQQFSGADNVDLAMKGWAELAKDPSKMQEMFKSLQEDPDIMAKAKEMMNDPEYMKAAKAKLAQLEQTAKARGMLDQNGMPMSGDGGAEAPAREYEAENLEKYKAGLLNDAELGMANLRNTMKDPKMVGNLMEMMKDPSTMAEVQQLMKDPAFKAQAQQMVSKMKQNGGLDALAGMARQQGMAGMGGSGDRSNEINRLRMENEALRSRLGGRDEL